MKSFLSKSVLLSVFIFSPLALLVSSCTKEEKKIKEVIENQTDKEAKSFNFGPDPTDN